MFPGKNWCSVLELRIVQKEEREEEFYLFTAMRRPDSQTPGTRSADVAGLELSCEICNVYNVKQQII